MKHVPVRYLDRLNRLNRKLNLLRHAIEDMDPEAAEQLERIEWQLTNVLLAINRKGAMRECYLLEVIEARVP